MAMVPWRPFEDLDRFFENEDWFLPVVRGGKGAGFMPAMDVYETEKEIVAEMNLPNIDSDKVEVTVEDQTLRVSGHAEESKEEGKKDRGYWRKEIRRGSFERMVHLPAPVKEDKIDATYEKGVLKIVMPKEEPKAKGTKVKIKEKKAS